MERHTVHPLPRLYLATFLFQFSGRRDLFLGIFGVESELPFVEWPLPAMLTATVILACTDRPLGPGLTSSCAMLMDNCKEPLPNGRLQTHSSPGTSTCCARLMLSEGFPDLLVFTKLKNNDNQNNTMNKPFIQFNFSFRTMNERFRRLKVLSSGHEEEPRGTSNRMCTLYLDLTLFWV